jgi:hypothetical protein
MSKRAKKMQVRTFENQAAQGDIFLRRVDAVPANATAAKPVGGRLVVAHSETGHHHYLAAIGVEHFTTQDPTLAYLRCSSPAELLHAREHDTHETLLVPVGTFEVRRAREYTPQGWRRVED